MPDIGPIPTAGVGSYSLPTFLLATKAAPCTRFHFAGEQLSRSAASSSAANAALAAKLALRQSRPIVLILALKNALVSEKGFGRFGRDFQLFTQHPANIGAVCSFCESNATSPR
jgi:hypothetical protein